MYLNSYVFNYISLSEKMCHSWCARRNKWWLSPFLTPLILMYDYAKVCYIGSMNKTAERHTLSLRRGSILLTPAQRATILRRGFGAWKGSVKESLRTLSAIRRGWDRKII